MGSACATLRRLLAAGPAVTALGAVTGSQAVQMARAGMPAVYVSGWQVAADANLALETYPDLGLYPWTSGPAAVRRIVNALAAARRFGLLSERTVPVIADAEAGFGGPLTAFEVVRAFALAGAAAVHIEDQLPSARRCGHLGGKVLAPRSAFVRLLRAAREAAVAAGEPGLVLIARTDAAGAAYLADDVDAADAAYIADRARSPEGYYVLDRKRGLDLAISRAIEYAPYADLLWYETSAPDVDEACAFATAVRAAHPGAVFAYNLSPSFEWVQRDRPELQDFIPTLADAGFRFQFVTLAGYHAQNLAVFELAREFVERGMVAYADLQDREFLAERLHGYSAVRHQRESGAAWYDALYERIVGEGGASAVDGSTEALFRSEGDSDGRG